MRELRQIGDLCQGSIIAMSELNELVGKTEAEQQAWWAKLKSRIKAKRVATYMEKFAKGFGGKMLLHGVLCFQDCYKVENPFF